MAAERALKSGTARKKRVSLPGVHELLRHAVPSAPEVPAPLHRQASGREAHPQKITVYLSAEELMDLERARLALRARGVHVDRGRLVREAIALLLADLDAGVETSVAARRLRRPEPPPVPFTSAGPAGQA